MQSPMRMVPGSGWAWTTSPQTGSPQVLGSREWVLQPTTLVLVNLSPLLCHSACEAKLGTPVMYKALIQRITTAWNTSSSLLQSSVSRRGSSLPHSDLWSYLCIARDPWGSHKYIPLLRESSGLLTMSAKASFWQLGMDEVDHRLCHGH